MNLKPSEAQKSAGNYKMRHDKFQGLNVSIENPKGSERSGIGKDGNPWSVKMPHDYGYIKGTEGADGDHVDVYIGRHKKSPHVFVIDQHDCDSGDFDEHKCMLGFANANQAAKAYDKGFSDGKGGERRRSMLHLSIDDFKEWLKAGNAKKSVKGFARGGRINKADGGSMPWDKPEDNPWDRPAKQPVKENETSAIQAGLMGAGKGATANWMDELEGLGAASGIPREAAILGPIGHLTRTGVGAVRAALDPEARSRYEEERDRIRKYQETAEKEHPAASLTGELAGSLAMPGGSMKTAGQAARAGMAYGLGSGLGSGEGLTDSAIKGGVGTLLGGAAGAVAPKISEKLSDAAGWLGKKFKDAVAPMRRMHDPETQTIPYFLEKLEKDAASGQALSQEDIDFARRYGLNLMGGDLGANEVRGLAKWASEKSPTARGIIDEAVNERAAGKADRVSAAIENMTLAPNARAARKRLEDTAGVVNDRAYKEAMEQGSTGFQSDVIDQLMEAPVFMSALEKAGQTYKNLMAAKRAGPPFVRGQNNETLPTLEFMNQVKKELDSMYSVVERTGDKSAMVNITSIKNQLVGELDSLFPKYQEARGIAANFFGAKDAIDAGKEMFKMANNPNLMDSGLLEMMDKMGSAERGLVASGYLTAMVDKIRANPVSINQLLKGPQAKMLNERLLGPRKQKEMETMLRLEGFANLLKDTVQGNSRTSQNMELVKKIGAELGWAGAGIVGGSALTGASPMDPSTWPLAFAKAAFTRGKDKFTAGVNEKMALKIAELITSDNPRAMQQATQIVSKNPYAKRALERNYDKLIKMFGQQAEGAASPLKVLVGPKTIPADESQEDKNRNRVN